MDTPFTEIPTNGHASNGHAANGYPTNSGMLSYDQLRQTGAQHRFQTGTTYHFGAITPDDAASSNWNGATYIAKRYPIIWDGEMFIKQGCHTIKDFLERGTDANGKPFPPNQKFLFRAITGEGNFPEYIYCGQFAQRSAKTSSNGAAYNGGMNDDGFNNGYTPNGNMHLQRHSMKHHSKHAAQTQAETQFAMSAISENARETMNALKSEIDRLQKERDTERKELAELKAQNQVLANENYLLKQTAAQKDATLETIRTTLQAEFDRKKDELKREHELLMKAEEERAKLEAQVNIQNAIREERVKWEKEREDEEQGLEDEIADELELEMRQEYRKIGDMWHELDRAKRDFEKEKLEWKKEQSAPDKGLAILGKLGDNEAGEKLLLSGMTMFSAIADRFVATKFPEHYQANQQEYERAKSSITAAQVPQAQEQPQVSAAAPQTPAMADEQLVSTASEKPDNYQY